MSDSVDDDKRNPLERLRDSFTAQIKRWVDLELDVEELAQRKSDLLKEYVREDVHGIGEFWKDLVGEVHAVEDFLGNWLLENADPGRAEWVKFQLRSESEGSVLTAGDQVTDVELSCMGCGKIRVVLESQELQPCSSCECPLYQYREDVED